MGLNISTNLASMSASRILSNSTDAQNKSYQRLSSGQRITQAGDDAAGLSLSENLRSQIRSMNQAEKNANDGISFTQVAEGGLTEISSMMIRLRELGIQAASDTVGDNERAIINQEGQSLIQEVDRLANVTNYNGTPLLNGQAKKDVLELQVGIHNSENDRITFNTNSIDARSSTLGIDGLNYESIDSSRDSLEKLDEGMTKVLTSRATLGSIQERLQTAARNLSETKETLSIARSRIADTDIATESSELIKSNILQAAGIAVLAQANAAPERAMRLIS